MSASGSELRVNKPVVICQPLPLDESISLNHLSLLFKSPINTSSPSVTLHPPVNPAKPPELSPVIQQPSPPYSASRGQLFPSAPVLRPFDSEITVSSDEETVNHDILPPVVSHPVPTLPAANAPIFAPQPPPQILQSAPYRRCSRKTTKWLKTDRLPPHFSGTSAEDATEWLRHFENYCAFKALDDGKQLPLFKVLLRGNAAISLDSQSNATLADMPAVSHL